MVYSVSKLEFSSWFPWRSLTQFVDHLPAWITLQPPCLAHFSIVLKSCATCVRSCLSSILAQQIIWPDAQVLEMPEERLLCSPADLTRISFSNLIQYLLKELILHYLSELRSGASQGCLPLHWHGDSIEGLLSSSTLMISARSVYTWELETMRDVRSSLQPNWIEVYIDLHHIFCGKMLAAVRSPIPGALSTCTPLRCSYKSTVANYRWWPHLN